MFVLSPASKLPVWNRLCASADAGRQKQFRLFLVEHPLVRHLTRRLLWGVYNDENALITCFRVAEDSTYSDAQDELFTLPAGNIGIPHVLEISPESAAAFRQIYADYELLPLSNSSSEVAITLLIMNVILHELTRWQGQLARPDALSGWNAEAGNVWKKAAAFMRCAKQPLMAISNLKRNLFH